MGRKSPKTHQREIPLETPCFYVLYRVWAQVGPGPGGAGWMARRSSGQFLLRWQFSLLPPGPQVWGQRPRPAAVGRGAPQVGPKTRERGTIPAATEKKRAPFPPGMATALRPGLGSNSSQPRKAGWIPQGGGRPRLWRFFPQFPIAEKLGPAPASPPGWQA